MGKAGEYGRKNGVKRSYSIVKISGWSFLYLFFKDLLAIHIN
jgi:hypothetical protein